MPISDYDLEKELVVASVSGTPSISKAQPIYLSGGDDSQTGTGPVVLDWSGINGPSDIAVYDESGNLLDYEIEELDTTNETGVLWVYNDWIRDGTVQAQVAYGNGPEDRSMAGQGNNPWDNGQNTYVVHNFKNSNSTQNDSGPNSYSMDMQGASFVKDGQTDTGFQYDGVDDYGDLGDPETISNDVTVVAFTKPTILSGNQTDFARIITFMSSDGTDGNFFIQVEDNGEWDFGLRSSSGLNENLSGVNATKGENFVLSLSYDSVNDVAEAYVDGQNTGSINSGLLDLHRIYTGIGYGAGGFKQEYEGIIDDVRIFKGYKSSNWNQADYDASAKAGQIFFSQNAAESTPVGTPPGVVKTDQPGVTQTDSDGVVTTG